MPSTIAWVARLPMPVPEPQEAVDFAQKMFITKKVALFRYLSEA